VPEYAAIAFGLSLALVSLAALAGWWLHFTFDGLFFGIILSASLIALAAAVINRRPFLLRWSGSTTAAFLVALALLALRLYQARDLVFPAWVDSVHHAFIVRILLEQGGLPSNFSPWIPVDFYYHFGFHTAAAVIAAISRQAPATVLLVFGQVLSVMVALSIYRLSMALCRNPRVALLAMALSGFVSEMPAFYLSWGRYTLLAGLVLLPLAMAEAVEFLLHAPRPQSAVRLALLTAGVLLTHYLAGILLASFLVILALARMRRRWMRRRILSLAFAACFGALLASPWLARMIGFAAPEIAAVVSSPFGASDAASRWADWDYFLRLLSPARNAAFLSAGLLAALFFSFRKGNLRPFALWGLILGALAVPWGFRLAPFRPDHFTIVLFLPASLLAAAGLNDLMQRWQTIIQGIRMARKEMRAGDGLSVIPDMKDKPGTSEGDGPASSRPTSSVKTSSARSFFSGWKTQIRKLTDSCEEFILRGLQGKFLYSSLLGLLCLWGAWDMRTIVNPVTMLADDADRFALEWVKMHTPPDARFLINATYWQAGLYRGVDGGYWLLPATGRVTILPPALYGMGTPENVGAMTRTMETVSHLNGCGPDFWKIVEMNHLTYVYIHEGKGTLSSDPLANCAGIVSEYQNMGINIYRIINPKAEISSPT
jgi:hypothetical protein